jgi:quercetin dioxygenase-like cupin family protein
LGYPDGLTGSVEPHLITLTEKSQEYPIIRHTGYEFIYMLQGEFLYRHSNKVYRMAPGDSLFFEATAVHGPEELVKLPIRLLSVVGASSDSVRT